MTSPAVRPTPTVHQPARSAVTRFIRRHPLASFFLWFFTVGQAFPWAAAVANLNGRDWPMQPFVLTSTLIGLLLPTLVITRIVDGQAGLRELRHRALKWRVGLLWYTAAFLLLPLVTVAIGVLIGGPPNDVSAGTLLTAVGPHFLLPLLVTFLPNNWWEEVAWMGFVQARLQHSHGPLLASVIVAPLFSLQHSALVVSGGLVNGLVLLVSLAVLAVPFRFLVGWIFNRTQSLFVVGLVHAIGNALAGGDGFNAGYLADLYPDHGTVTSAHLLAFFVLGLSVAVVTRGRLGRPREHAADATH